MRAADLRHGAARVALRWWAALFALWSKPQRGPPGYRAARRCSPGKPPGRTGPACRRRASDRNASAAIATPGRDADIDAGRQQCRLDRL